MLQSDVADEAPAPADEAELEDRLSRPTAALVSDFATGLTGDILVLGAGGKMGPSLARMGRRALDAAGRRSQRVIAVARFSDPAARALLEASGVETLPADLSDRAQVERLPDTENLVFMAGQKFGTAAAPERTWAMNAYVPAVVAERYAPARPRTVVFSTGCVYPNTPVASGGSREEDPLEPLGEYANSCVARERLFEHFAGAHRAPLLLFRLNYAVDLRYGVPVDIARKVRDGEPIDLTTGHVNVIWQGDANAMALRSLLHAAWPPVALNVTGPETVSVRDLAHRFGDLFGRPPILAGEEADTALLSNAARALALFGPPEVPPETLVRWCAAWQRCGGRLLNKPTRFEARDGRY